MAKNKEAEDIDKTAQANGIGSTADSAGDDDKPRRAGGRTIARWKKQVFAELPDGDDQATAGRLNEVAQEEGYEYHCAPATVARWRQIEATPHISGDVATEDQEEGHAYVVLHQLSYLLGKNVVKKLINPLRTLLGPTGSPGKMTVSKG